MGIIISILIFEVCFVFRGDMFAVSQSLGGESRTEEWAARKREILRRVANSIKYSNRNRFKWTDNGKKKKYVNGNCGQVECCNTLTFNYFSRKSLLNVLKFGENVYDGL